MSHMFGSFLVCLYGGGSKNQKTNIEGGGITQKGGFGKFADLWGGGRGVGQAWQERGGGVFQGKQG